jgi:chitinase
MNNNFSTINEVMTKNETEGIINKIVLSLLLFVLLVPSFAQVNTGGTTTASHQKQVIGYITQWDAWKAANAGLPAQGALTHLNIDYAKYTILNYSFFGVASDGSLHSGDFRDKNIYQPNVNQAPADLFYTDVYSSWDLHILFGELEYIQYISAAVVTRATAQGFVVQENASTWSHPGWRVFNKPLPLPLRKETGAPGLLALAHSKGVKVMASIGGWSMCKHFPQMAADPVKRQRFIDDCKRLINMGFDGIDLDWEYPGPYAGMNFTGTQADYANFTTLVSAIRSAIGSSKLITAAFSADPVKLQGFQWSQLNNLMNYYNIMSYDFNGGWSNKAGHNAPLFNYDGAEAPTFNWQSAYNALVSLGVAKNKINMGSPFYGRGVITQGSAALNATTVKRSETVQPDGPITTCADYVNWPKEVYDGTPNYFFVKQKMASGGWTRHWDNQAKVPYLTNGTYFLSYDDVESIGHKAQFIVDNQLAGTIVWTVFGDLEISGSPTQFGPRLIRYSSVKSELVNKLNSVFATGNTGMPTVSITSPANGATVPAGSNVVVSATASDSNGSITKVEFLLNGAKVGEDTSSPYSFTINNIATGNHTIGARAIDNSGNTATASVSISAGSNQAPIVSITAPTNGQTFAAGATITIAANASDPNGSVTKVEFFRGGTTKLGEDTTPPFSYTWGNVASGNYSLTARATDNSGLTTTSTAVSITVGSTNPPPTVSITAPSNGATFTAPVNITITATASDNGSVTKVEFFDGSAKLGEDTSSPYSYVWNNVSTGAHTIMARATDNQGATASSSVNITVNGSGTGCSGIPQYVQNGGYVAGSKVQNVGSQYECKPFPFSGWCNGAAWAYGPGTGAHWQDAWILKGSCAARVATFSVDQLQAEEAVAAEADGLSVYPNPGSSHAHASITLTFKSVPSQLKVSLKSVDGRKMHYTEHKNLKSNSITIELSPLPGGMYILDVHTDKQLSVRKYFIK